MENKTELRPAPEGQPADTFNPVLLWRCADLETRMLFQLTQLTSLISIVLHHSMRLSRVSFKIKQNISNKAFQSVKLQCACVATDWNALCRELMNEWMNECPHGLRDTLWIIYYGSVNCHPLCITTLPLIQQSLLHSDLSHHLFCQSGLLISESPLWLINTHYLIPVGYELQEGWIWEEVSELERKLK